MIEEELKYNNLSSLVCVACILSQCVLLFVVYLGVMLTAAHRRAAKVPGFNPPKLKSADKFISRQTSKFMEKTLEELAEQHEQ